MNISSMKFPKHGPEDLGRSRTRPATQELVGAGRVEVGDVAGGASTVPDKESRQEEALEVAASGASLPGAGSAPTSGLPHTLDAQIKTTADLLK